MSREIPAIPALGVPPSGGSTVRVALAVLRFRAVEPAVPEGSSTRLVGLDGQDR
jgi:hypothetical protein